MSQYSETSPGQIHNPPYPDFSKPSTIVSQVIASVDQLVSTKRIDENAGTLLKNQLAELQNWVTESSMAETAAIVSSNQARLAHLQTAKTSTEHKQSVEYFTAEDKPVTFERPNIRTASRQDDDSSLERYTGSV